MLGLLLSGIGVQPGIDLCIYGEGECNVRVGWRPGEISSDMNFHLMHRGDLPAICV